jgi:hypothetical protein
VLGMWEGLYKLGRLASNCREVESTFLYPYREKKSISNRCFLNAIGIPSVCIVEFI